MVEIFGRDRDYGRLGFGGVVVLEWEIVGGFNLYPSLLFYKWGINVLSVEICLYWWETID